MEERVDGFAPWLANRGYLVGPFILLGITLAMFGDVLFASPPVVLSHYGTDLSSLFIHLRDFGFRELRQGNLALWNPHLFSGVPFLAGFQSALLYPPNWVHLVLPVEAAINLEIAFHIFLVGTSMYLWACRRGLHPVAALLSGTLVMFGGPCFLNVFAGHLPHLATLSWAPLVFLAVDGLLTRFTVRGCLLGGFAVAMQILAGYPPIVFHTAVAVTLYLALGLFATPRRGLVVVGLACIYLGGAALAAVQLLPGAELAVQEGSRGAGVGLAFAGSFSFPPENLLTALVPGFFGDVVERTYWGRWYAWETTCFLGVTGLLLAVVGIVRGEPASRRWPLAGSLVVLLILALGANTPLFPLLYASVPGFNLFRGNAKFIFQAAVVLAMLAGIGLDRVLRDRAGVRRTGIATAGVLLLILGGMWMVSAGSGQAWASLMSAVQATGETFQPSAAYADPGFQHQAQAFANRGVVLSAVVLLLVMLALWVVRSSRLLVGVVVVVAMMEVIPFARSIRETFDPAQTRYPEVKQFLEEHPGDYRILLAEEFNAAMSIPAQGLWGYDAVQIRRYAELMAMTQGQDPDQAVMNVEFVRGNRLFRMLRGAYIFMRNGDVLQRFEVTHPMPRLHLLQQWELRQTRDDIFAALNRDDFDPWQTVLLETPPDIKPVKSPQPGTARIIDGSTDHLDIQAEVPTPSILLITDSYSQGWRAVPLPGSTQQHYRVQPANYVLRAIPLSAGSHRLRLEYAPTSFLVGTWISMMAVVLFLGVLGWSLLGVRRGWTA